MSKVKASLISFIEFIFSFKNMHELLVRNCECNNKQLNIKDEHIQHGSYLKV